MPAAEQAEREKGAVIEALLATIPNLPAPEVPKASTRRQMSRSAAMAIPNRCRRPASMRRASISSSANPWG
jgi:hypothetical protein